MKNKIVAVLLGICFLPLSIYAEARYEAEKTVKHTCAATSSGKLILSNKYGNISIQAWDKNEASIVASITTTSSRSNEHAQEVLETVEIVFEHEGNRIVAKTVFSEDKRKALRFQDSHKGYTINYSVHVPKNMSFDIDNKYGNIWIDRIGGSADVELKYGDLRSEEIVGKSSINIGYGNFLVSKASNLSLDVKYGNITIGKVGSLNFISKYNKVGIDDVESLSMESKYDKVEIGRLGRGKITAGYTPIIIDLLTNELDVYNKYGSIKIEEVATTAKKIAIDSGYTPVSLILSDGLSYKLQVENRYGSISVPKNLSIKNKEVDSKYSYIEGTGGSGKPSLEVEVKSSYNKVSIVNK